MGCAAKAAFSMNWNSAESAAKNCDAHKSVWLELGTIFGVTLLACECEHRWKKIPTWTVLMNDAFRTRKQKLMSEHSHAWNTLATRDLINWILASLCQEIGFKMPSSFLTHIYEYWLLMNKINNECLWFRIFVNNISKCGNRHIPMHYSHTHITTLHWHAYLSYRHVHAHIFWMKLNINEQNQNEGKIYLCIALGLNVEEII